MTIRQVELIRKKEIVAVTLDPKDKVFVVYIASIIRDSGIYLSCKASIAFLKLDKTFTPIPSKYADFADLFSKDIVTEFPKYNNIKSISSI